MYGKTYVYISNNYIIEQNFLMDPRMFILKEKKSPCKDYCVSTVSLATDCISLNTYILLHTVSVPIMCNLYLEI